MQTSNTGLFHNCRRYTVVITALLVLLLNSLTGCAAIGNLLNGEVVTVDIAEPLGEASSAEFEIYTGNGNLTVNGQAEIDMLASGSLQYQEKLGLPTQTLELNSDKATLTLHWGEGASCMAAIEWLIHLNPTVPADLNARSGGGNVNLDLTGMNLSSVFTETGAGNVDVMLPGEIVALNVTAKSGAGNVVIIVPSGTAAHIHATTGLGKLIIDEHFVQIDAETFESTDYDTAVSRVELTLGSGAGNVEVKIE